MAATGIRLFTLKVSCFDDSIEVVTYFRGRAVYFAAPLGAPN